MTATTLNWMDQALCRRVDVGDVFFPGKGGSTREAKQICADCPVTAECLNYALDCDEREGIYGGLSPTERRTLSGGGPRHHTLTCDYCSTTFTSVQRTARYCGSACAAKARSRRDRGTCLACGGPTSQHRYDYCHDCSAARNASTLYARGQQARNETPLHQLTKEAS